MNNWRKFPHKIWVVICLFLGVALIPAISGCEKGASAPINLVMQVIGDFTPLPDKVEEEFNKFVDTFKQKTHRVEGLEEHIKYSQKKLGPSNVGVHQRSLCFLYVCS